MKIIGYTCTYNEAGLIPYVMPYVEAFGYDKFIVWDNESTDGTVEMLKKYPFVEVRTYKTNGEFNNEAKKSMEIKSYEECKELAKTELVWMTWTDFDEVLFFNSDVLLRDLIEIRRKTYGYNCFFKRIINLFPPLGAGSDELLNYASEGNMIHTLPNIRGGFWTGGGMKPLLFCVNDLPDMEFFKGNHYALSHGKSKDIKNYDGECELYAFHLKFIDKLELKKKWETYAARGNEKYSRQLLKFDTLYQGALSTSFPIEQYFLMDGIMSKECREGAYWSGIKRLNG